MHRQSLGSLSSHVHGGPNEDSLPADYDHDNHKSTKPHHSPPAPTANKSIHLVPFLLFLCFFILYLFSRPPSRSELAQFNGFKRAAKHLDTGAVEEPDDIARYTVAVQRGAGETVAIRSLRNLRDNAATKQSPKSRPHRKFLDPETA